LTPKAKKQKTQAPEKQKLNIANLSQIRNIKPQNPGFIAGY